MKVFKINLLFSLAIIVLIVTGILLFRFTCGIVNDNKNISDITSLYESLEDLRIQIRSTIIAHRDYMLTQDTGYLAEYLTSKEKNIKQLQSFCKSDVFDIIPKNTIDSIENLLELNFIYLDSLISLDIVNEIDEIETFIDIHSSEVFRKLSGLNTVIEHKLESMFNVFRLEAAKRAKFSLYLITSAYSIAILILIISFIGLRNQIINRIKIEKELRESNKLKDKFFSIVAHDLRAPFTFLLNLSSLINEAHSSRKEELVKEILKSIENISMKTFNLLNNLLQWANTQTGILKIKKEKIDIHELIEDNLLLYEAMIREKEIAVFNESVTAHVYADKNMINTVIRNLISNAIRYTQVGGEVKIHAFENDDNIEVFITDNGTGMNPDDINKLFRLDVDTRQIISSEEKGSGLGLILCKEFIDKHNGEIKAELNTDRGCTFSFKIPKL